jgi:prolyl 4-hydroxylase
MSTERDALIAAVNANNPHALALMAYRHAFGFEQPRDIDAALNLLMRSAASGWRPAQGELRLLARDEGSDWNALRAKIDIATLRSAPPKRSILENPRVRIFENFATPSECDWLIACGRAGLQPAQVYQADMVAREGKQRTNTESDFVMSACDTIVCLIRDRIAAAVSAGVEHFEIAKLLHYDVGQRFARHRDCFDPSIAVMAEEIEARGQRVATFLIYLNDGYEGGETAFLDASVACRGRKGDALFFLNVDGNGAPDLGSTHAGRPVTHGEKWVLSQWIRSKPINAFKTPNLMSAPLPAEWYRFA